MEELINIETEQNKNNYKYLQNKDWHLYQKRKKKHCQYQKKIIVLNKNCVIKEI